MGQLYYIRHGQASVFSDNYDQLSDIGKLQSKALGKYLKDLEIRIDKIFVGPLHRHRQTLDGISIAYSLNGTSVIEVEGLREHEGYAILKKILPSLMELDPEIKDLVNRPFSNREEQIKHHIRIYDRFALRWAQGTYDDLVPEENQSWTDFHRVAREAFHQVSTETTKGEIALVITSGGPKSVACGQALDLSIDKVLELSSIIYNGSYSTFKKSNNRVSLTSFNNVHHLREDGHRTLV